MEAFVKNIVANSRQLTIIGVFVGVFFYFVVGRTSEQEEISEESRRLRIGLCKRDQSAGPYFEELEERLTVAFEIAGYELLFEYKGVGFVLSGLKSGYYDIGGELSPMEYVAHYKDHDFSPLVGIEYDGRAYYHSLLFIPLDAPVDSSIKYSSTPGIDNIDFLTKLVREKGKMIAHSNAPFSASGFYYPQAYMLQLGLDRRSALSLDTDDIYREVLMGLGNDIVAGFLPDFRYEAIRSRRDSNEADFEGYAEAYVIDKSDPIPHGVFVLSDEARKGLDKTEIIRIWKTVRDVRVGGPDSDTEISSWRSGPGSLERDLAIVELHKRRVDYDEIYRAGPAKVMAIIVVVCVILLSSGTLIVLRRT